MFITRGIDESVLQSTLRIAENQNEYRYRIDKTRSTIETLNSISGAPTTIEIVANESTVSPYEY